MSLKVLVLSHMYPNPVNRHAGVFVHNQCKALIHAGIEIRVVSPIPSFPFYYKWNGYQKMPKKTEMEGISVQYVPTRMFPGGFFFSTYGYFYQQALQPVLKELYKEFPFDLIHCHTIFPDGNAGIRLKKHFQVPVLSTIHGSDLLLYPKRSKGVYKQTLLALQESDQIITVSQRLQNEAETIWENARIQTIYNGFDPEQFQPGDQIEARRKLNLPLEKKICLFVGNLYPVKGLFDLFQAFSKLAEQTDQVQLVIVGDGKLKVPLQKEASKLGLQSAISFMGRRSYDEIPSWLQSADVVVLSSLSEGMPSILLESMACGKPMVATDVGGIAEILKDGETGRLVPARNPTKLAEALIELLVTHPEQVTKMGENAYRASQAFTWSKNAEKVTNLYQQVLSSKNC